MTITTIADGKIVFDRPNGFDVANAGSQLATLELNFSLDDGLLDVANNFGFGIGGTGSIAGLNALIGGQLSINRFGNDVSKILFAETNEATDIAGVEVTYLNFDSVKIAFNNGRAIDFLTIRGQYIKEFIAENLAIISPVAPLAPEMPEWFAAFYAGLNNKWNLTANTGLSTEDALAMRETQLKAAVAATVDGNSGGNSNLVLGGNSNSTEIYGGAFGPDLLIGDRDHGNQGGPNADFIRGTNHGNSGDVIFGDNYTDVFSTNPGLNPLTGGSGQNDVIFTNGGTGNVAFGQGGNDIIISGNGSDQMFGGADDDILISGNGSNVLAGGAGRDWLIVTGTGRNVLEGGEGDDVFLFSNINGKNTVNDFTQGEDLILLAVNPGRASAFGDLVIEQRGLDTVISVNHHMHRNGETVLRNFDAETLTAEDVMLVNPRDVSLPSYNALRDNPSVTYDTFRADLESLL